MPNSCPPGARHEHRGWAAVPCCHAFARYSRDNSFAVLGQNKGFLIATTVGSITGTIIGGLLLGVIPDTALIPLLVVLLLLSSIKVWNHS